MGGGARGAVRRMPRRARRAAQGCNADEPRHDAAIGAGPRQPTSSARSTSCGRASRRPNPPHCRPAASAAPAAPASRTSRTVRWLAAAVVVQGFGLALFGFNALRDEHAGQRVRHRRRGSGAAAQCAGGARRVRAGSVDGRPSIHCSRTRAFRSCRDRARREISPRNCRPTPWPPAHRRILSPR